MSVQIHINGDDAGQALAELRTFSAGLFSTPSTAPNIAYAHAAPEPEKHAEPEAPKAPAKRTSKKAEAPAAPEPEVAAQDAADEAAEEGTAEPERVQTVDDVRAALGAYVKKYGMPAAQEDGKKLFVQCGHVDGGVSKIPADNADLIAKIVAAVETAIASNPYGRAVVG